MTEQHNITQHIRTQYTIPLSHHTTTHHTIPITHEIFPPSTAGQTTCGVLLLQTQRAALPVKDAPLSLWSTVVYLLV
jgi:hypothetical protein